MYIPIINDKFGALMHTTVINMHEKTHTENQRENKEGNSADIWHATGNSTLLEASQHRPKQLTNY